MGKIESEITVPNGARPLADYARYYAQDTQGIIWGSYTPEADQQFLHSVAQECQQVEKKGILTDTPPFPCPLKGGAIRLVKAGERLWITTPSDLPGASGGGCGYVTFQYNPKTGLFRNLECNGTH